MTRNSLKDFAATLERGELVIPRLKLFLEKRFRQEEKGIAHHADFVREDARLAAKTFNMRIEEYNHGTIDGEFFHPSQIGACMRKTVFDALKAPVNESEQGESLLKSHLTFEIGTYFHVLFGNLIEMEGSLVQREIAIQDRENRILGHMDGLLWIKGDYFALEMKTINSRQFTSLKAPHEGHVQQFTAYMKSRGLKKGVIIYFDKDRSQVKEFQVKFSEKFWLEKVKARIDLYFRSVKRKSLPEREGTTPYKFPCMFCQFSRVCFDTRELAKWTKEKRVTIQ